MLLRRLFLHLTPIFLLTGSTGCTTANVDDKRFEFATLITDEGLKLFELRYPLAPITILRQDRMGRAPENREQELSERRLLGILESRIEGNGFCRSGYFLLGRHSGLTAQKIRGECRESATEEDRQRFPNSISRW